MGSGWPAESSRRWIAGALGTAHLRSLVFHDMAGIGTLSDLDPDARAIASAIAARLWEPEDALQLFGASRQQSEYVGAPLATAEVSLSSGFGSLVLLFGELAAALGDDQHHLLRAHSYLSLMASEVAASGERVGLLSEGSVGSLRFCAGFLAGSTGRYAALISSAEKVIEHQTHRMLEEMDGQPIATRQLDVVSGLAGIAAALLSGPVTELGREAVTRIAGYFTDRIRKQGIGGLRVEADSLAPADREEFPHGAINTGVAHGVAGVMAVIAIATIEGIQVKDSGLAIDAIAEWLSSNRSDDEWGPNWTFQIGSDGPPTNAARSQSGWCYGPAGIGRALDLASEAADQSWMASLADDTLLGIARRPTEARILPGPGLCHGRAGLLAILLSTRSALEADPVRTLAGELAAGLVDEFSEAAPVGFKDVHRMGLVDDPGFLSGATGVALSLLFSCSKTKGDWRRALLIA